MKQEKVLDAILRSSAINIAARGFGYIKNVAIAILIGFNAQTDAFFMALTLIGIFFTFADVFDSIGVPNLVRAREESRERFLRLSGLLLTFTTILAVLLIIISIFSYPLISRIAIGFTEDKKGYLALYFYLLLPYLFLNFFFHHFGAILRSERLFTPYFIGELIFSIFSCIFIGTGLYIYKNPAVLPISLSMAQVIATGYMIFAGKKHLRVAFFMDNTTKEILRQFFYLTTLYGVGHVFTIIDKAFASILPTKCITALSYGLIIASVPTGILKLGQIVITSLSEADAGIKKLNFYVKKILLISSLCAIVIFIFAPILVKLLLGYGRFSHEDLMLTVDAAKYYALSLPCMFLWPIFYRWFQIKNTLKFVFVVSIVSVLVMLCADYLFVIRLKMGIIGIPLGCLAANITLCVFSYLIIIRSEKSRIP
ncbi:murein biosynthesis integral membrane protein MurJ [bacterium]|nr:murein biosynthesis integral membrane protein MurJ [bacterium]MBU1752397.1 murein biosynthesis integral membrane protein MurJ [bacterium]